MDQLRQTTGPPQQARVAEEPPRQDTGVKPPAAKAIIELKPKQILTQNMTRQEMIAWERQMKSYFKASNFELCSMRSRSAT